ncbi:FRMD8-like protein [Mya arenaria]|uniref:FRMD8-like protein n=1 Tax=Mya arenaria TaxID=6604 RepID=A0ABY7FI15_MYAAR|nr:FRMD8-like protein [Mya arenaria]
MADGEKQAQKQLPSGPSLDYGDEVSEGTRLMYEKNANTMDENQSLPSECEDVFALWLVSPLLELRLKKKHKPFFMVKQWDELCSLYTDAKATEIQEDEPVLITSVTQFYPEHIYRKPQTGFFKKRTNEQRDNIDAFWLDAHRQISQEFEHEDIDRVKGDLYRRYLDICRPYPFYGAAFFDSFINKPLGKLGFLKRNHNIETWTAINTNGVTVIDREKDEVLLAVPFTELCWEYVEPQFDVDDDSFPALLLQFLVNEKTPEGQTRQVTKVLQVFSRQARMMIALIESGVDRKKKQGRPTDAVDGNTPSDSDFHERCSNKLQRLCLSTFSKSGECLD